MAVMTSVRALGVGFVISSLSFGAWSWGGSVRGSGAESIGTWGVGSNGADVALNRDGTRAFVASGAPYNFRAYDTSGTPLHVVQILPGDSYPNNIEVTEQGITLAGASVWYGATDIWLYQASGVLLSSHKVAGYARNPLPRQLKASGDGLRLVALTSDPKLVFLDATQYRNRTRP